MNNHSRARAGAARAFVILGAGPAGLAAAYRLCQRGWRNVSVIERADRVGGNAGSFAIDGIPVDFGSHRLHPACPAPILADLRELLGDDLLDRPRFGRIRLRGRWLHFPLRPFDLLTRLPPTFIAGALADIVRRRLRPEAEGASFASILEAGLGSTICRDFYFPYARKIWGLEPAALDPEQARRRVSSSTVGKLLRRVTRRRTGAPGQSGGRFFYPRQGYGQISEAYRAAAVEAGATVHLGADVTAVCVDDDRVDRVEIECRGVRHSLHAAHVLSTIPIPRLIGLVQTRAVPPPRETADALQYRAMVLIYLSLETDQFTPFDAHYFPEAAIRISRLSEPKNYSLTPRAGRTVLCAELPCATSDPAWSMSTEELRALVCADLERAGLGPLPRVLHVEARRLSHAYPLYTMGYRQAVEALERWVDGIEGLVTFGRQGLFAHDNTHHTIAMAYAAVDAFRADGTWDRDAWARARRGFDEHVVED